MKKLELKFDFCEKINYLKDETLFRKLIQSDQDPEFFYPKGKLVFHCLKKKFGDAGYRSRYLPHAKRALYHLSYTPDVEVGIYKK